VTDESIAGGISPASDSPVALGAAALDRHAWQEAYETLSRADANGRLTPAELEMLADAAWWTGRLPVALEVRERGYAAATRAGDVTAAVTAAIGLGRDHLLRNDIAIANAWLNRAGHLLDGVPENIGHGYLAACRAFSSALSGDAEGSLAQASAAVEIGERLGDRDLTAFARSEKGSALVSVGRIEEGLALIDDATVAAVGGELEPRIAGGVCCASIETCQALGELNRAAAWTEAQDRWCRREAINGYPGMCRVFRAGVKQFRGAWLEAEAEARQASIELEGFMPAAAGSAFLQIGELRMMRGDLPGAEEALMRAHALGTDPEPTLSLLRLAEGRVDAAAAGIARSLDEPFAMPSWRAPPGSPLHRLPLLRAQVAIALASSDAATARAAADALREIVEAFPSAISRAASMTATGAVELAEGSAEAATRTLRGAVAAWNELAAPYDAARARMILADAHEAAGSREGAMLELHAARAAFERLGAAPDLRRAEQRLAQHHDATAEPAVAADQRVVRTFIFTDIVDSTRLAEVLGDEAWGALMRRHDRSLREVIREHGGEEIKATGDGFFLAFADAGAAIDAMVAVQRRLAADREEHGFAPAVRIGLHTAEASRTGLDYLGRGVNYAARIGAAAGDGEIVASEATLMAARREIPVSGKRSLTLKGIAEPVTVASIPWR
jgi:class 3 adenylate cyclase